jgi:serine/threonine-protein kinase
MIGRTLGRYRIEEELGSGGMGVVYRALDTHLKRTVAIKVIRDVPVDQGTRAAILREARAASALNHPHICTVYEVGQIDDCSYIAMEHVEGRTLNSVIPPDGLSPELAVRYGIQIADALAHAHDRGVVHRDLKGSNVMVTPEGRVKVLDFGLARRVREGQGTAATESAVTFDDEHTMAGTVAYMAPEVLQGQSPDRRDDVWALGVLLYETATGEHPFSGDTKFQLASAIQRDAPAPPPARVPAGLRSIILRCLAPTREERYQHAGELRAALEAVQSDASLVVPSLRTRAPRHGAAIVLAAVIAAATIATLASLRAGMWSRPIDSIAVLPFVNVGGDPDMEYLSDGLTEGVISGLSQVPQEKLKTIALSPVLRYKGQDVDVQTVGRALGVRAIVLGRVVLRGGALSVSVELVSSQDRTRLWGDKYETPVRDILAVQREIATRISDGLRLQLTRDERQRIAKPQTENAEAYQLYLKGRYHWYKFTPEDYEKSLQYYHQAIERDSGYALAYAGIALTRVTMAYEGLIPPREARREAEAAALKAVAIDDTLGEAHDALAQIRFAYDWNWSSAEQEFRRALSLSRDPATRRFYGHFLRTLGRWDEAIAQMKAALELDQFSVETSKALGATYFWAGQHDRAIDQYVKTLELDANHAQTHDLLADAYAAKGLYGNALAERRTSLILEGADEAAEALGTDASEEGYRRAMRVLYTQYLAALDEAAASRYVSPMEFAMTYVALGDKEQAFAWLEKAYDERAPWLVSLKSDPAFDPLRSDRRFHDLGRRVGLP